MGNFCKIVEWIVFIVFLFLGIGCMPSDIGGGLLLLAFFLTPIKQVKEGITFLFTQIPIRWTWILILLVCITRWPMEAYAKAGKNMGRFLYTMYQWLF